ncbi:MAG: hypothetical protein ACRCY4_07335 [Brevinema sp.]
MKSFSFVLLMLVVPMVGYSQETYGNANAAKKVLVVRPATDFKKAVSVDVGNQLATDGYSVQVVEPKDFKAPVAGTLVVYLEGATAGTPWDDTTRNYLISQKKGVFYTTFKRANKPFNAVAGIDVLSGASKDNRANTATTLVAAIKKQL